MLLPEASFAVEPVTSTVPHVHGVLSVLPQLTFLRNQGVS